MKYAYLAILVWGLGMVWLVDQPIQKYSNTTASQRIDTLDKNSHKSKKLLPKKTSVRKKSQSMKSSTKTSDRKNSPTAKNLVDVDTYECGQFAFINEKSECQCLKGYEADSFGRCYEQNHETQKISNKQKIKKNENENDDTYDDDAPEDNTKPKPVEENQEYNEDEDEDEQNSQEDRQGSEHVSEYDDQDESALQSPSDTPDLD